mgnify:CR=1 FL=1
MHNSDCSSLPFIVSVADEEKKHGKCFVGPSGLGHGTKAESRHWLGPSLSAPCETSLQISKHTRNHTGSLSPFLLLTKIHGAQSIINQLGFPPKLALKTLKGKNLHPNAAS